MMLQPETPSNSSCLPDLLTERVAFGRRADHFHLPTQSRQARVAAARKETFHESSSGSPDQRTPPSVTLSQPTTESRPARFPDESSSVTGPSHTLTLAHPSLEAAAPMEAKKDTMHTSARPVMKACRWTITTKNRKLVNFRENIQPPAVQPRHRPASRDSPPPFHTIIRVSPPRETTSPHKTCMTACRALPGLTLHVTVLLSVGSTTRLDRVLPARRDLQNLLP